jgi:hypothetical protein
MKRITLASLGLLLASSAFAADNAVVVTPGTGVTMRSKDIGSGVQSMVHILGDTSGNPIYGTAGTANANILTVQGIASMTPLLATVTNAGTFATQVNGFTSWAGGTLGAMANYGTSPGAVLVPGVNASVTASVLPTGAATSANQTNASQKTQIVDGSGNVIASTTNALNVNVNNSNANGQAVMASSSPVVLASDQTVGDPCTFAAKTSVPISQTSSAQIITGTSSKKTYVCSIFALGADAENMSLVEGTGSVCATGTAAVIGSTTAGNGPNFAANGGFALGGGAGSVAIASNANADNVCLLQSGSGRVAGVVTYVQR